MTLTTILLSIIIAGQVLHGFLLLSILGNAVNQNPKVRNKTKKELAEELDLAKLELEKLKNENRND